MLRYRVRRCFDVARRMAESAIRDGQDRANGARNANGEQGGIPARHDCGSLGGYSERKLRRYGVRSAVTRRASFTTSLEPAARRQEASKFGQACCEQSLPTVRISSRSPLASACGTLASTWGAKPGNTVSAAAMNAATAIAEKALIMTVPCHGPLRPVVRW